MLREESIPQLTLVEGEDHGSAIAVDNTGSAYIVGDTNSGNVSSSNAVSHGFIDAFVTKLAPNCGRRPSRRWLCISRPQRS